MVAISNRQSGFYQGHGLDIPGIIKSRNESDDDLTLQQIDFSAEEISNEELLALDVDILIPAAVEATIHQDNVDQLRTRLIVEAANLPVTAEADATLQERGIPVIPDLLANAGGVIVSYLEWVQNRQRYSWKESEVNNKLESTLHNAWKQLTESAESTGSSRREAAYTIGTRRVKEAIELRGF